MGNDDLDILQLFLREEAQLLAFAADAHLGFLLKIQGEDHDDHAPDGAVAVGGDAARLLMMLVQKETNQTSANMLIKLSR